MRKQSIEEILGMIQGIRASAKTQLVIGIVGSSITSVILSFVVTRYVLI